MGNEKWVMVPFDFCKLKHILFEWQTHMAEHHAWNAVFWCNHDQPRVVSRFGNTKEYWKESAKMLATVIHCMRGTPYIYQGEELGMTNPGFHDISQYRDVESINHFRILQEKGLTRENAYQILAIHSRDNSRTPMQWSDQKNGGFSQAEPWIEVNDNCAYINAETEEKDEDSIFHYYQKLITLRKKYDIVGYGDFEALDEMHPSVLAYRRNYRDQKLLVINNFYGKEVTWEADESLEDYTCILSNYEHHMMDGKRIRLKPYEALVLYREA